MCGIASWFSRTEIPNYGTIEFLAKECEKRGKDGFGFCQISKYNNTINVFRCSDSFSDMINNPEKYKIWREFYITLTKTPGKDIYIMIARAAPETEYGTDSKNLKDTLQPIVYTGESDTRKIIYDDFGIETTKIYLKSDSAIVCVHNGAVSNKIKNELHNKYGFDYQTKIDSEAIIAAYKTFDYDIKRAFEYLSGGFSVILYDRKKDMIYLVNDFKPLACGSTQEGTCVVSSIKESCDAVLEKCFCYTSNFLTRRCNYLKGGFIRMINKDGFTEEIEYSPRYITPFWDSNEKILKDYENGKR